MDIFSRHVFTFFQYSTIFVNLAQFAFFPKKNIAKISFRQLKTIRPTFQNEPDWSIIWLTGWVYRFFYEWMTGDTQSPAPFNIPQAFQPKTFGNIPKEQIMCFAHYSRASGAAKQLASSPEAAHPARSAFNFIGRNFL